MGEGFRMKVSKVNGKCPAGYKEDDVIKIETRGNILIARDNVICGDLFHAIYPACKAVLLGGELPWQDKNKRFKIGCPDPENQVVVNIKRVKTIH